MYQTWLLLFIINCQIRRNITRTEVVEHNVDLDDLLNNEIGAIVRVQERGSITPLVTPFVAGQTLGALQYYDSTIDSKTGITKASAGLEQYGQNRICVRYLGIL